MKMNCPKCSAVIPDDSTYCTHCGCNISEAKKQMEAEQQVPPPAFTGGAPAPAAAAVKKSKAAAVLAVLLVLSVIGCAVLGFLAAYQYSISKAYVNQAREDALQIYSLQGEIDSLTEDKEKLEKDIGRLQDSFNDSAVARDALLALESAENWGYATKNFHANTGVVYAKLSEGTKAIEIVMNYDGSTCYLDCSNTNVAEAAWSNQTWYYGEVADVFIEPKSKGIAVLTFTNTTYDNYFNVLVIVE